MLKNDTLIVLTSLKFRNTFIDQFKVRKILK